MKLVAATRILNESDIVEAFVRHTAHHVDHHLFIDNGSIDGTVDILRKLREEGLKVTVFQSRSRSFIESQALTALFRQAAGGHQADWVVMLDTDEVIDDRLLGCPLREHLARQPASVLGVRVRLRDYHLTPDDTRDPIVPHRMRHCTPVSDNMKMIVRGSLAGRGLVIQPGSHSATFGDGSPCPAEPDLALTYAHYPSRSPYQWISKFVVGWAKVLAAGPATIAAGHGAHYRDPFDYLRTDPAHILRNPFHMLPQPRADVLFDPIAYRGGSLRYTSDTEYPMRATQVITQYLHEVASQHDEMLELVGRPNDTIRRRENEVQHLF